jgi:benzoate membrane transport protein
MNTQQSAPVQADAHKDPAAAGWMSGLRGLPAALNLNSVSAGLVAAIFGCSGPALIVIGAAQAGNLSNGQTVAWLLAIYLLGGIISLFMGMRYRMPITGAYSIPGAAIMTSAFATFSYQEAVGAFIMAGVLVLILGVTGVIGRIMRWVPMPIVMAMIAGAMIRFGIAAVDAVSAAPLIAGLAALAFFLTGRLTRRVPPVLAALVVGLIVTLATGQLQTGTADIAFVMPQFTAPVFTLGAFFGIAVPLAALVIGAENAQAIGVLMAEGYKPPINAMTIISGVGGIVAGMMGGHNANIAGPMTAICSSEQAGQDKDKRYGATVVNGLLFGAFGMMAGLAVPFVMALPKPLIGVVAGLAMIGVLLSSLQGAFGPRLGNQVGAFVAFVVGMSSLNLLGISAPFWALVFGVVASVLADKLSLGKRDEAQTSSEDLTKVSGESGTA